MAPSIDVDVDPTLVIERMFHDSFRDIFTKQHCVDDDVNAIADNHMPIVTSNNPFVYTWPSDEVQERCYNPTILNLHKVLTVIRPSAFLYCEQLTTVNFPPSLNTIGAKAFRGCRRLKSVVLPDSVTSICPEAFRDCDSLTEIVLPQALDFVSVDAFVGCTGLRLRLLTEGSSIVCLLSGFESALIEAGFTRTRLADVVFIDDDECHTWLTKDDWCSFDRRWRTRSTAHCLYYHPKIHWDASARRRNARGRLPLCLAAEQSLPWSVMKRIFVAYMPAIEEDDSSTGLRPFMLAAVGARSDLESIYSLLRQFPQAL